MIQQHYPLEWMDSLISLTLNPAKMYFKDLTTDDIQALSDKAVIETIQIQSALRNQVFALHKESQIRLLVQKYHSSIIALLDTLQAYQDIENYKKEEYSNITATLTVSLDELLFFIETRFSNYLSLDERVPPSYLKVSRAELEARLRKISKKLIADIADPGFTTIVLDNLKGFVFSRKIENTSFRQLLYYKELLQKIEALKANEGKTTIYNSLNELLIYMNFNSRGYISYFTKSIADKINALESKEERIDSLHFHYKEFCHLQSHHDLVLYPERPTPKTVFGDWFHQEILYLQQTIDLPQKNIRELKRTTTRKYNIDDKVRVNLTSDQIAIILRALDESRLLESRSMSQVFKTIVPFLSTPGKSELSYDSVRNKSYTAEARDRKIAVEALEKLIAKINTY